MFYSCNDEISRSFDVIFVMYELSTIYYVVCHVKLLDLFVVVINVIIINITAFMFFLHNHHLKNQSQWQLN